MSVSSIIIKDYSNEDFMCAVYIRYLRLYCARDMDFDVESVIHTVCCDQFVVFMLLFF